ncbi:MAG: hypothetical protein XD98_0200 [Microgenomates bacterium 39_6]|nr:MAG: hypothetical protein XD98_0200 [Microgenomates bacterium 39_6]
MIADLSLIASVWLVLLCWQLVGFPLTFKLYANKAVDAGWAFGRLTTWLIISTTIWFLAHLGLPVNQPFFIYFLFIVLSVNATLFFRKQFSLVKKYFSKRWKLILTQEIIFLIFFVFLCLVRAHQPKIEGLEKFMDVGFIAGYLNSPTLPAEDIWLAGETINYYTYGHFLGAIFAQFMTVPVEVSYNLLLGMLMGMVAIQGASVTLNLSYSLRKIKTKASNFSKLNSLTGIKAAILGGVLLVLAGNGHATWYFITNGSFDGYWYPNATRFIERTIHEFPAYSFIVSDLHAHVWGMPLVLFILFNIYLWLDDLIKDSRDADLKNFKFGKQVSLLLKKFLILLDTKASAALPFLKQRLTAFSKDLKSGEKTIKNSYVKSVVLGILLGLAISTSTWDFLIYSLLLGVIGLILLMKNINYLQSLIYCAMLMIVTALVTASPWLLNFVSISEGVRWANERSPFWQLLVLWGPHVLLSILSLAAAVKLSKKNRVISARNLMIVAMVITSVILLILPELIFMKDIYPDHPRANTMFKLTFQAFMMMTLVISWLGSILGEATFRKKTTVGFQLLAKTMVVLFVVWVGYYSFFGYRDFYGRLSTYQGLDGLTWLQLDAPGDYEGILWLRENAEGRPVVLEAVGESYTTYARVSTFTGFPTVLGWRVHEWLWRGGFDIPAQRTEEVREIYENPGSVRAKQLLKKHQVKYIFIGSKEREAYSNLNYLELKELGETVFQSDETIILGVGNK